MRRAPDLRRFPKASRFEWKKESTNPADPITSPSAMYRIRQRNSCANESLPPSLNTFATAPGLRPGPVGIEISRAARRSADAEQDVPVAWGDIPPVGARLQICQG